MTTKPVSSLAAPLGSTTLPADPAIILAGSPPAATPAMAPPANIEAQRQAMLATLLNSPRMGATAHGFRAGCLVLNVPEQTAKDQKEDPVSLGAVDLCIGSLTRQARDGAILSTYQETIDKANAGKPGIPRATPTEAAAVVQRGVNAIKSGSNVYWVTPTVGAEVRSGPALDLGFTAAWMNKGEGLSASVEDEAKFRTATEVCTSQQGNPKQCFAVGYVHGARAYINAHPSAALEPGDLVRQTARSR